ncbi:hypothetical protein N431DRAFT_457646 [Stipitochalara longipes BDJ]|nr:hypothetical protein N431DRAFT_457646 [Stipitochalara longipes BDJ]
MVRFVTKDDKAEKTQRGMEVITAGLSRCATSSLQAALESSSLGYAPTMHMSYVLPYSDRLQLVIDALREKDRKRRQKILHKLFDGYGATCDFPGMIFVDDLMDMYPNAKVILNQRASGKVWAESISNSLAYLHSKTYYGICFLFKTDRLHYRAVQETYQIMRERVGVDIDNPFTPEAYAMHNKWVRDQAAKRGKVVLDWQAEDGWKPLCAFLGKPVPDTPFPHLNDQRAMMTLKAILTIRGLLGWLALVGVLYAGVWFGKNWL